MILNPLQDNHHNKPVIIRFSSFLDFRGDGYNKVWRSDSQLRLNMQRLLESTSEKSKESWARYFLGVSRGEIEQINCGGKDQAQKHLSAYLQKVCESVAIRLYEKHYGSPTLWWQYGLRDYFQMANLFAHNPRELLKNFRLELPSSLQAYARERIQGKVEGEIRQQNQHLNRLRYSDWGLLRNVEQGELAKALRNRQILRVEHHIMVWQCYREIYVSPASQSNRRLNDPTMALLQDIADCCNQRCDLLPYSVAAVDAHTSKQMLKTCAKVLRDWRIVRFDYPDAKMPDFSTSDRWDLVSQNMLAHDATDPLAELAQTQQWQWINSVLAAAFAQLPTDEQTLLMLDKQGLGLTGTQIGLIFGLKQFQVSRQLKYSRRKLLKALVEWCQEHLNIQPSNEEVKQLDSPLKSWLNQYCQACLFRILEQVVLGIAADGQEILRQRYRLGLTEKEIALNLQVKAASVATQITVARQQIQEQFTSTVEKQLELEADALSHCPQKIATFVENWLPSYTFVLKEPKP
ncbi:MAG: sigma-70 family RNA polymerase sigma factor [Symploca sp. SIO2G7]|nr:sigma-70 family RNA polymerase sigma factor [Symploca sp. SIO2G7]